MSEVKVVHSARQLHLAARVSANVSKPSSILGQILCTNDNIFSNNFTIPHIGHSSLYQTLI